MLLRGHVNRLYPALCPPLDATSGHSWIIPQAPTYKIYSFPSGTHWTVFQSAPNIAMHYILRFYLY